MNKGQLNDWRRAALKWAGFGAALGGLLGLWFVFPAIAYSTLAGVIRTVLVAIFAGGALGAAVGSLYAGKGRKWFWVVVVALGVIALPVTLLSGDLRRAGVGLIVAAAILAVAFGVWVLLAVALQSWRTRRSG
jgi:hypothetical protein